MKKLLIVALASGVLSALMLASTSWSQSAPPGNQGVSVDKTSPRNSSGSLGRGVFGSNAPQSSPGFPGAYSPNQDFLFRPDNVGGDTSLRRDIVKLMNELRDAEDDAKKADITKQLETAIDKYFDEDMTARETELAKLEERLTKLRSQLDRRRKAKAEIIKLQIKVMANEAEGLGFSGSRLFDTGFLPVPGSGSFNAFGRGYGASPNTSRTVPAAPAGSQTAPTR